MYVHGNVSNLDILMDLRATNSGTTMFAMVIMNNGKILISVHKDPNNGYTCIPHSQYLKIYTIFLGGELIFHQL